MLFSFFLKTFLILFEKQQPCADWHGGRFTIRETAHPTVVATNFPVQPLNGIVDVDACPVFAGEVAAGKRLLNALLRLLDGFFQLHGSSSTMARAFS